MIRFIVMGIVAVRLLYPDVALATQPAQACRIAAAMAERQWGLPPDLVAAIGRTESGRFDPKTQQVAPWPWTVNAAGTGAYFPNRQEAMAFVRALQTQGVRVIDVGCFQVDLLYHPDAFASLEDAFDPGRNADYAGRFLSALHAQTGSWPAAVARYHSGRTIEGAVYQAKVFGQWQSAGALVNAFESRTPTPDITTLGNPDRFVVLMSAAARAVKIFHPAARD